MTRFPFIPETIRQTLRKIELDMRDRMTPKHLRFLKTCRTLVHIGANTGQERHLYNRLGLDVLWIEPIPNVYEALVRNLADFPHQQAFQGLISAEDGHAVAFNVASNEGASSSMLEFGLHRDIWPEVGYIEQLALTTMRLDTAVKAAGWDTRRIDALLLDTQGAELLVLQGADRVLDTVKFILTEAADFEAYKDGATVADLEAFLVPQGFSLLRSFEFAEHPAGGKYYDVLFGRGRSPVNY
ncbi:FkbM family methyltransferase [Silicimonas algicola]|uniref:FkbM family methyltransferase n=1 Tax=Silicimonas algicola TaxID=1826607 RepID=A0A316FXJ9_9RHOB|nr:FkbM family methyltransferase [Silicimonas algicola]AZQ66762.1 FkbM family methyltransferase [Silicimonas algicola]PWK53123.1 FkbM family methyltransferase [Silicimonas algicola]